MGELSLDPPSRGSTVAYVMSDPEHKKAVVVLSGGMDSCVCAALAVQDFGAKHVAALHVSYGQRTEAREQQAFREICDRLGIARRLWCATRHWERLAARL